MSRKKEVKKKNARSFCKKTLPLLLTSLIVFYVSGLFYFWLPFSPNITLADSSEIFSDGLEDSFNNWTDFDSEEIGDETAGWDTSGGDVHSGEKRAQVTGGQDDDTDTYILLKNVSTENHEDLELSFWYKTKKALEEEDHVYIEWTANSGESWSELDDFTDQGVDDEWLEVSYELPSEANNNLNFGFRFRAVLDAGNDKFQLDDISLSADTTLGKISGYKWEDADGDGERDDNEPALNGWTIWLDGDEYVETGEGDWPDGYYEFSGLEEDYYIICEELPDEDKWTQTYPNEETNDPDDGEIYNGCGEYEIELAEFGYEVEVEGNSVQNLNFGNFKYGRISGHKYAKETNEPLKEWTIYLGRPNGDFDWTNTDEGGFYEFNNLGPGVYKVCENFEEDEETCSSHQNQSYPEDFYTATISSGFESQSFDFWNYVQPALEVIKFYDADGSDDRDEGEEFLSGWEFCLYAWSEENEDWILAEGGCKSTNENGQASWFGLEEGNYLVDEEERENWFHTNTDEDGRREVELEGGKTTEEFGNVRNIVRVFKYWDKDENGEYETEEGDKSLSSWEMCLYNLEEGDQNPDCKETDSTGYAVWEDIQAGEYRVVEEIKDGWTPVSPEENDRDFEVENGEGEVLIEFGNSTTSVDGWKFYDINESEEWDEDDEPGLRYWELCLYRWELLEEDEWGLIEDGCKRTDDNGSNQWIGLDTGLYKLQEEERDGWLTTTDTDFTFELGFFDNLEFTFGNWIKDNNSPSSSFDEWRDHEIIDTELVSLELTGISQDQESGVSGTDLRIYQLGDSSSVEDYPAQRFFDVFNDLNCPNPNDESAPIPIELVSLSLTSVSSNTVNWNHDWTPPSPGIYCFEARATDYAENVEETALSGPLAYVPVVQISNEVKKDISTTSATIEWQTEEAASSRVIYDTVSHSSLGNAPNYGYDFSSQEEDTDPKVLSHSVVLNGLTPATIYYYRTISAASPESVSSEGSFNTQSNSPNTNTAGGGGSSLFLGSTSTPTPTPTPTLTPEPIPVSSPLAPVQADQQVNQPQQQIALASSPNPQETEEISPSPLAEVIEETPELTPVNLGGQFSFAAISNFVASLSWWVWLLISLSLLSWQVWLRFFRNK